MELRQTLGGRPDTVQWYVPVESRACGATGGDRDDFDPMAAVRQGIRKVPDTLLLPTGHRGIELRHHQDSHAVPQPMSSRHYRGDRLYLAAWKLADVTTLQALLFVR